MHTLLKLMIGALVGAVVAWNAHGIGYRAGLDACPAAAEAKIERDRLYYEWVRTLPPLGG